MTSVRTFAAPGRPPRWLRALLVLVTLLCTALMAGAPAGAATAPPAAASSPAERGELHHDASDTALRLPTGHATRFPTRRATPTPHKRSPAPPVRPHAPHAALSALNILRCVVLRC